MKKVTFGELKNNQVFLFEGQRYMKIGRYGFGVNGEGYAHIEPHKSWVVYLELPNSTPNPEVSDTTDDASSSEAVNQINQTK